MTRLLILRDDALAVKDDLKEVPNDYVYVFAGGELPNEFLSKIGVRIDKRFGT